jgi:hypothetical protein
VVSVRDQGGAVKALAAAEADAGGDLVADEPDDAGCREYPQEGEMLCID